MRIPSVALVAFLVIGCGSDGGADAARAKCETLKVTDCARIIECGVQITQKECTDAFAASLDCGRAVSVSASYSTCIQELRTFSCVVLNGGRQLPASCTGAILIQ